MKIRHVSTPERGVIAWKSEIASKERKLFAIRLLEYLMEYKWNYSLRVQGNVENKKSRKILFSICTLSICSLATKYIFGVKSVLSFAKELVELCLPGYQYEIFVEC